MIYYCILLTKSKTQPQAVRMYTWSSTEKTPYMGKEMESFRTILSSTRPNPQPYIFVHVDVCMILRSENTINRWQDGDSPRPTLIHTAQTPNHRNVSTWMSRWSSVVGTCQASPGFFAFSLPPFWVKLSCLV